MTRLSGVYDDLSIELGSTATFECPCCGRTSTTVHGYLWDSTGATTVYFAGYTSGHPDLRMNLLLSVGEWGEGTTPDQRRAIPMQYLAEDGHQQFCFPPVESSPWYGHEILGPMVDPATISAEEKLNYENLIGVALAKDPRIAEYLQNG
jgi:hypothetical protein